MAQANKKAAGQAANNKMAAEFINAAKAFESAEIVRVSQVGQDCMAYLRCVSADNGVVGGRGCRADTTEGNAAVCGEGG